MLSGRKSIALALVLSGPFLASRPSTGEESNFGIEGLKTLKIGTVFPPPEWALLERHLLETLQAAATEFLEKYTRDDHTLIWRDVWPGMDGSDDGYESFYNFPLYYMLGGPEEIHHRSLELWDGVTRQFTRYGQIYREFDGYYDWMHHGESYVYFYFFGLTDPTIRKNRQRAARFAGLYLGEDLQTRNWDPQHKLIRSPINGSRGPRFVNSAEDWVTHRPVFAHYPLPFDDLPGVTSSDAWVDDEKFPAILETMNRRMMRGDVPLNLTATSLMVNAYLYTGGAKYRRWVLEYIDAWIERTRQNGGIIPDNVGLSGKIGENMDGKWWGGYYGWRWPHGFGNLLESTTIAASNALLLTGDKRYLDLPRSQIDIVIEQGRLKDGRLLVPHKHGARGWYAHGPLHPQCPIHIWFLSGQEEQDWARIEKIADVSQWKKFRYRKHKGDSGNEEGWVQFVRGRNPNYPEKILRATYRETLQRLQLIRDDRTTVDEQDVHHWQQRNPVVVESLLQLMLGGPSHLYHGGLLHCQVRYFDPRQRRPGVPDDVAALVERIHPDGITLTLCNLDPSHARDVIVQAGAYSEHRFTEARQGNAATQLNGKHVAIHLAPGVTGTLELGMERYAHRPTYAFPWHGEKVSEAGRIR